MAQYEAAQKNRSIYESDASGSAPPQPGSRNKMASRGRVQIKAQPVPRKVPPLEPLQNGGSALNVHNNMPSGYSPDMPQAKNARCNA